ncbi:MAG: dienelactone hydrolase family protein [Alphaproteobacteria bacterium]|nr:dienelactone hydrolase family protein [Alphaproteobacteria bacterium]MBV9694644.1 dienelactone hydrolase family protein [Alphaproteobacteria bacterium]
MRGFPSRSYVAFASLHERPLTIAARLMTPSRERPAPAVVLLHGSAGPSTREGGYAEALHAAGFVTLEPDLWSARGLTGGDAGRPKTIPEILPDVFGAHGFLARRRDVDPRRIGVAGFSFGGVAAMLAATKAYGERFGAQFAAFMPFYPACWTYNVMPGHEWRDLVDAPLLLVTGALDDYDDDPQAGPKLVASLPAPEGARACTKVFEDCHHGFDMPGIDIAVPDPLAHRGQGGQARMRHHAKATAEAHRLCVEFFKKALD